MEMAPPKRWARRSSVGALLHSPEHVADSLLLSREAYMVWRSSALGLLTAVLLLFVLYAALTAISPQSEQRGPLSVVAPQAMDDSTYTGIWHDLCSAIWDV